METIKFTININATKQIVWEALWNNDNYPLWTAAFGEGNKAVSDWNEGSKIYFIAKGGGGLCSIIEKKIIYEQIIFKHIGELKNGQEVTNNWVEAKEQYFLTSINNVTTLTVYMDTKEEYKNYFNAVFPKALAVVKSIAENEV